MKTLIAATVLALGAMPSFAQQTAGGNFYPHQDRLGREAVAQTAAVAARPSIAYYPHVDRSGDVAVADRSAAVPEVRAAAVSYYPHTDRTGDAIQVQPAVPATTATRASRGSAAS